MRKKSEPAGRPRTRREFLKGVGAGAAALALPACVSPRQAGDPRPNILFIMADDHARQAMSCYGSRINSTPNLDRIAAGGVRFDEAFCTNAICAPSRAVLLTGKYSHVNGLVDNAAAFDGAQPTFPKLLQAAGYETALFGKWHLKVAPAGFDYWCILPGQGEYYNPDFDEMGEKVRRRGYVTDLITNDFLDWLRSRSGSGPFCALLQHKAPHRSWMPDLKHLDLYASEEIQAPETFFDDYANRCAAAREQTMSVARDLLPAYDLKVPPPAPAENEPDAAQQDRSWWESTVNRLDREQRRIWDAAYARRRRAYQAAAEKGGRDLALFKYQCYIKDYLRCIASVDENVGRVLDYLRDAGLAENTLVVYTSDQGFYLGEHGWFDKRFMYEESLRIPLLMRWPRAVAPGAAVHDMVINADFAPTFLELAGAAVPGAVQGRSLQPILAERAPADWRRSIYYHYYEYPAVHSVKRHYGVRTQRYKLIHFYHDIDAWELFDLEKDPRELRSAYDDPAYAAVRRELEAELARLRDSLGDGAGG